MRLAACRYRFVEKHLKQCFAFVVVADLVDEIKNINNILNVFDDVVEEYENASLHIIGDGPDAKQIENTALNLSNSNRVKFYGRLANQEVISELPSFHCLVNNSRVETFGVTVLEAHAAGLPVISTTSGGPDEWLEEGDISIDVDDTNQLKEAMVNMIKSNSSQSTFKKWKSCLPHNVGQTLESIYRKVLN